MTSPSPSAIGRYCASVVAAALALQPLGAYAAITTSSLAEIPLQGVNPVLPNIVLTFDDSESMNGDYLPDFTRELRGYCRDNRTFLATPKTCGITAGPFGSVLTADPPIRSSAFNGQFYDPTANYLPGLAWDSAPLPCEGTNGACGGPWTSVYVNGFAGYPGSNGGATTNLVAGYPDTAWCNTHAANPPSASDLATATDPGHTNALGAPDYGSICRLNGRPYPAYTEFLGASILWTAPAVAAGYNYPNVKNLATGGATTCLSVNEDCIFGDDRLNQHPPVTVTGNPFYYTVSKVQFCSNQDVSGFGIPPCVDRRDATTYKYVRYGTDPNKSLDPQAFTRVDIKSTGFLVNGVPAANPTGRTYAAEMANFAKWYAFDRTRLLAMKTAAGRAFAVLNDKNARVGFHTLAENTALFKNVDKFDATNKKEWFTKLYSVTPPVGQQTPLPDAVYRIGEYFRTGTAPGLPAAIDPLDSTTGQCQMNFHLLATDGYWNFPLTAGSVGDQDLTVPSLPGSIPGFTPGSAFPRPYFEGPSASSNSLADLAMKYWINDLRPTLANKVPDTIAPWQHVSLYGVSIGAQGNVVYPRGVDAITTGTADWPRPSAVDLPPTGGTAGPDSIDDLWHAALNSRGKFFNATNPQELANSIVSALNDFIGPNGTGTGVGIAGAQLTGTNRFGYLTSYDSTWAGDVKKYAFNSTTGAIPVDSAGNPLSPPVWSAQAQLDTQVVGSGWDTNRRIVTINDSGVGVPFRIGNLSAAQQASLIAGWSAAGFAQTPDAVLNYLRGDKSNEGVAPTSFRVRTHALGDIVYSGAVAVGAPREPYDDSGNPGFQTFVLAQRTRTPTVYVGANDGMVHAFNDPSGCQAALDPPDPACADAGKETWAYVPKVLFNNGDPNDDSHAPSSAFQLGALSYNPGIPRTNSQNTQLNHTFYVNATPRVWDIDVENTNTSTPPATNDWRTLLVGGLGAGGRAVYALDVTNPAGPPPPVVSTDNEASVASKVLWEFTDANLGYVFDAPTLVKTRAYGWVVLVASGYNNPGGKGFLYVLNPKTGGLVKKISLPGDTGSDPRPTGLSTVRAFTSSRRDPYVLQAYSGDINGNVWRFDLSSTAISDWKAELLATLKDDADNAQPITTGIRIEIDQNNNVDRYLFVGTGKLLDSADIDPADPRSHAVTNSLYVIRDGTRTAAEAAPTTPYSRSDLGRVNGALIAGGTPTARGWFQDGSDSSQKIGTDVFADVQTVVYSFSKPQTTDPCLGALTSTLFARDFTTGASVLQDQGGTIQAGIDVGEGVAGIALIQGQSGEVRLQVTTFKPVPGLSGGQVFSFGVKLTGGPSGKHRVSWRLINKD